MYRAVLFDLYDTVVLFRPRVPATQVAGTQSRSMMGWMAGAVEQALPGVVFEDFLQAIVETTAEIVRNRPPEYREVPSRERFRRALVRLRVADGELIEKAERLSQTHMRYLAAATEVPPDHLRLLRTLAKFYPLGLVSNFDHGPTAQQILVRHGLTTFFKSVVISDGFGRRKPHPAIFLEALQQLGVAAVDGVFVGDNPTDDVSGARQAGMDAVWLNPRAVPLPEGAAGPTHTISHLIELQAVLGLETPIDPTDSHTV